METGRLLSREDHYTQLRIYLEEGRLDLAMGVFIQEVAKTSNEFDRDSKLLELKDKNDGVEALLGSWPFLSGNIKQTLLQILVQRYLSNNDNF